MIPQIDKIFVYHNEEMVGVLQMTPDGMGAVCIGAVTSWEPSPSR